jgi:hypothetical protein
MQTTSTRHPPEASATPHGRVPDATSDFAACAPAAGEAGTAPGQSPIDTQMRAVVAGIGSNEYAARVYLDAWDVFRQFLEQRGTLPERTQEIDPEDLARFAAHCRSTHTKVDALLATLSSLYLVLKNAGYHPAALAALIAPTHRVRAANSPAGKYRFPRQLRKP